MRFSQRWWVIVVLLFAFAVTVSAPTTQTEEPSPVNAPSSAEVQSSSDEPEQKQSTLTPNRDMTTADVEIDRRVNELWRELLNNRKKTIDDRAKMIDWWLEATAIFLTLLGVAAAILGYFGFKRLDRIESEARENLKKIKEEAQRYVEDIKTIRDKLEIDRAHSEAILLQQQNRTSEAIEKWRSIANITEGTDDERAAEAWFNIGYLLSPNNVEGEDFVGAIAAYDKTIELDPSYAVAYFNRGNAKASLGQTEAAIADYDTAIGLNSSYAVAYFNRGNQKAQLDRIDEARQDFEMVLNLARAMGNADLATHAARRLENLG